MYAVSLLPAEYKNFINIKRRNDKLIFIGLIAALGSLILLITSIAISSVYDQELNWAKRDNKIMMKRIEELKPVEILQAEVSKMVDQINQTSGLSPLWNRLITDIGNSCSPKVTFNSINAQYKDQSGNLVIIGTASSHDDVSTLIQALSKVDGLGEIKLKSSSVMDSTTDVQFELDIEIIKGFPYELKLGGAK